MTEQVDQHRRKEDTPAGAIKFALSPIALTIFVVVLALAFGGLASAVILGWAQLGSNHDKTQQILADQVIQNKTIQSAVVGQTTNRAYNVAIWCGAINQDRNYNGALVDELTHTSGVYQLRPLPCDSLVRATIKSTGPALTKKVESKANKILDAAAPPPISPPRLPNKEHKH